MSFSDKVVIVTGASSGIGADVAKRFAAESAKVVLVGRNESNLAAVRAELQPNTEALIVIADVCDGGDSIIAKTLERFGRIDILVNNAGILLAGTIETTDIADFDRVMDVNLRSVFQLTQKAIPSVRMTKGNIVNVSSVAGTNSFPNALAYCVSKAALNQFTMCTALELAPTIRVNSVNPGTIQTNIHLRSGMDDQQYAAYMKRGESTHALGRIGHSFEVTDAVLFLASEKTAGFITGTCLLVDGGKHVMCDMTNTFSNI